MRIAGMMIYEDRRKACEGEGDEEAHRLLTIIRIRILGFVHQEKGFGHGQFQLQLILTMLQQRYALLAMRSITILDSSDATKRSSTVQLLTTEVFHAGSMFARRSSK